MAQTIVRQINAERIKRLAGVEPIVLRERVYGALGDIPFSVSREVVQTISSFTWRFGADIAEHKLAWGDTIAEPTGRKPGEIELRIMVTRSLGVDPLELIARLKSYCESFTPVALVIGEHTYGRYRWLIADCTAQTDIFSPGGGLYSSEISVALKEYLKGGAPNALQRQSAARAAAWSARRNAGIFTAHL